VRLAEAPSFGKPILLYDVQSVGAKSYLAVAQELLRRVENSTVTIEESRLPPATAATVAPGPALASEAGSDSDQDPDPAPLPEVTTHE
jgi:hypothetical protein